MLFFSIFSSLKFPEGLHKNIKLHNCCQHWWTHLANQHVRIISEESCDTNNAINSAFPIKYIWNILKQKVVILYYIRKQLIYIVNIFHNICFTVFLNSILVSIKDSFKNK